MEKIIQPLIAKEKLPLIKKSQSFNIIIPSNVENKIRFVLQQVHNIEWSGTLFYKIEGSFENNNLSIVCKDIFVMDIGNSVYTEFSMSPDVIGYMADNMELLDCQMGLIHSHHNMNTFFSGTDINTLLEEGTDRNHFVSLIVNNEGTYNAAITRKIKYSRKVNALYSYNSFENTEIKGSEEYNVTGEEVEYYFLNVVFEDTSINYKEIKERLNTIIKNKNKVEKTTSKVINSPIITNTSTVYDIDTSDPELFDWDYIDNKISSPTVQKIVPKYNNVNIPKELVRSLMLQLITGCVVLPNNSKIEPTKWVTNMESLFNYRFGKDVNGFALFSIWADSFIEYICWYTEHDCFMYIIDDGEKAALLANAIKSELQKLPENKYIKEYIKILSGYEQSK